MQSDSKRFSFQCTKHLSLAFYLYFLLWEEVMHIFHIGHTVITLHFITFHIVHMHASTISVAREYWDQSLILYRTGPAKILRFSVPSYLTQGESTRKLFCTKTVFTLNSVSRSQRAVLNWLWKFDVECSISFSNIILLW